MAETRRYFLDFLSAPDGDPLVLDQRDMDVLLDAATESPAREQSNLVDFALLSTSDGGPVLHRGDPISEETAEELVSQAVSLALRAALDEGARR